MGSPGDRYIHLAEADGPSVEAIQTATKQWDASDMFGGHFDTDEEKVIMLANFIDVPLREKEAEAAKFNRIANEALDDACVEAGKVLALETQIADLKERSDIMDSVHKEMMEKIQRLKTLGRAYLGDHDRSNYQQSQCNKCHRYVAGGSGLCVEPDCVAFAWREAVK